jgi:ATP-dependent helicase/nuclease subunit B
MGAGEALTPRSPWLAWARERDRAEAVDRVKAPEPRPSVEKRPRKLSVSRIEAWISNPYAIFARDILTLEPLDPLGAEPGPALRGSIIHEALAKFSRAYPHKLPDDIAKELVQLARTVLDEYAAHPRIAAFWIPRFERFAEWFAETEPARRAGALSIVAETTGSLVLEAPFAPFRLTARADRIDARADGLIITDYKTGQFPPDGKVLDLVAPQLPLEAAIALAPEAEGGFAEVPKLPVSVLRYIRASGAEPAGEERDVKCEDAGALAARALAGLKRQVARFDDAATPYTALRRARFSYDYDEYAHLARVAEWSAAAVNDEED